MPPERDATYTMPGVMQAKMEIGTPILGKEGLCAQIQVKSSNH